MMLEYSEILTDSCPVHAYSVFCSVYPHVKSKHGGKVPSTFLSLSLLPSPLPFSPPLPLPPSPTPMLPAVFSCFFANGHMRTQHKLGKCPTAETQPQPRSHLKDIYKVPSTAVPFLQVFFPSLCFVLVSFLWL